MIFYIDASNKNINLAIFDDQKLISSKIVNTNKNMTEILVNEIKIFFKENNINTLNINKKIKEIYIINGPGSFTSIKLQSIFVNLIKVFFKEIKLFELDSCSIQKTNDKCICVVKSGKNNSFAKLFINNISSKIIIIKNEDLFAISKKYEIPIINSIDCYDIEDCFIKNKKYFIKVERAVPNYVKKAI